METELSQEACMFENFSSLALALRNGSGFISDEAHRSWSELALETQRVLDAACGSAKAGGIPAIISRESS